MKRAGFTLVELLVVIAIIMLLVALILPLMRSARIYAQTAVCLSNEHQIGLCFQSYVMENRGFMPSNYFGPIPTWYCAVYEDIAQTPQTGTLWPYVEEYRVYVCPLDKKGNGRLSYSSPSFLRNKPYGHVEKPAEAIFLVHESADMYINNGHREGGFSGADKASTLHAGKVTVLFADWHACTQWYDKDFQAWDIYIAPFGWNDGHH
jgi:prepilin-type N-terminal cleavage/methylation domain-containing protein/prepilin-type processing-associated H-X9-DG protein